MSRSTIKEKNKLIDSVKQKMGFKSRRQTLNHIYNEKGIAGDFKKLGFDLSHYMDGCWTLSNYKEYGFKWFYISKDNLFNPILTIKNIEAKK